MTDPDEQRHTERGGRRPEFPHRLPAADRARARLQRQFDKLRRDLPWFDGWIRHLQSDRAALIRVPAGVLLTLGGVFSFLPLLGIWMLPLGLMLLAIDIPWLQTPVAGSVIRLRRRGMVWLRWWRQRRRH